MEKTAEIISINGNIAKIKVQRNSMCEHCAAREGEGCTCSHGSLLGADRSMSAEAFCDIPVLPGDKVEVVTSDAKVLWYAMLVFIVPIIVCAALYAVSLHISASQYLSVAISAAGFLLTFCVIGIFERKHRKMRPDITVIRVIEPKNEK